MGLREVWKCSLLKHEVQAYGSVGNLKDGALCLFTMVGIYASWRKKAYWMFLFRTPDDRSVWFTWWPPSCFVLRCGWYRCLWQILYGVRLAWVDENSVALVDTYMRNASKMNVSIVDTDFWKFRQSVVSAAECLFVATFLVTAELAVLLLPFLTVGDGGESCAVATYCSIAVLALRGDVRVFCVVADDYSLFLVCVCKYRSRGNHCHNCYQTENHLFHFLIPWIRVGRNF